MNKVNTLEIEYLLNNLSTKLEQEKTKAGKSKNTAKQEVNELLSDLYKEVEILRSNIYEVHDVINNIANCI